MKKHVFLTAAVSLALVVAMGLAVPAQAEPWARPASLPGTMSLATLPGIELGGQISGYHYQEHVVPDREYMEETGPKIGLTLTGTQVLPYGFFATLDGRFAFGRNDYSSDGTGTADGFLDFLGEGRFLAGKDFAFGTRSGTWGGFVLAPYVGFGYRRLFNDGAGITTTTGARAYDRTSQYYYLPVGLTPRFRVNDRARVSVNVEYDYLLFGRQRSELGDAVAGESDIRNKQDNGYGLRGSAMYELAHWSFGPFANYWNINQSDTACSNFRCGFEPHNQTIEGGVQVRYRF